MRKLIFILLLLPLFVSAQNSLFTVPGQLKIKKVPNSSAAGDSALIIDLTGNVKKGFPVSSAVLSVGGTASRITSTGGIHPVIDISASYVGQSSITTLGTIISGVWHGTVIDPAYLGYTFNNGLTNTSGVVQLGGTLSQTTTENLNGFNFNLNQTSGNIQQWQHNGTMVANVDIGGVFYMDALRAFTNVNDALLTTRANGFLMSRNRADSVNVIAIINKNPSSTGAIVTLNNSYRDVFTVHPNGSINIKHTAAATAANGQAIGYYMTGMLQPSQNGDELVGMEIAPNFGISTIATYGSLVGGSGYTDGSFPATLSGGTGKYASGIVTVSGGIVTAFSIVSGINYTVGDVLTIVSIDGNTPSHGSGATLTVTAITTYTGITKTALKTFGLDQYDQDYSTFFTGNSKVNKTYVDGRVVSNSYTLSATAQSTFTISIGSTMPNNTYKVNFMPTSSTAASTPNYVTNKTTTSFDVVFTSAVTGVVSGDWAVFK